jgi:carboxypeptidase family protein
MARICWWLVDRGSRILEPDERDVVLGDFAESGVTAERALCDLLDLVVRRQAALWTHWRPWLALLLVVAPFGILLGLVCRWWAEGSATTFYLYVNGWTWAYLESPGARLDLARNSAAVFLDCSALICWSWTSGFALGRLSRRAIWATGTLFCLVLSVELLAVRQHHNPYNPGVWSLPFYSVMLPGLARTVLVFLPSIWGMHKALRLAILPPLQAILWAVAIATVTGLATRELEVSVMAALSPLRPSWGLRLLPFAAVCPAVFMLATAKWRHWFGKAASCVLVLGIVTVVPVLAKIHSANVPGEITDPGGGRVVNATVIARNKNTHVEYRSFSDTSGRYKFESLPLGSYDLTVDAPGFKKAVRENIELIVGATEQQDFSLKVDQAPGSVSGRSRSYVADQAGSERRRNR